MWARDRAYYIIIIIGITCTVYLPSIQIYVGRCTVLKYFHSRIYTVIQLPYVLLGKSIDRVSNCIRFTFYAVFSYRPCTFSFTFILRVRNSIVVVIVPRIRTRSKRYVCMCVLSYKVWCASCDRFSYA